MQTELGARNEVPPSFREMSCPRPDLVVAEPCCPSPQEIAALKAQMCTLLSEGTAAADVADSFAAPPEAVPEAIE